MTLCNAELHYVDKTKYLGVELLAARSFKCLFERAKIKLYRCFNAMMCKAQNYDNELICVHLFNSMCLPIILYAVEVVQHNESTIRMFNAMVDRAVFRIFGCASAEDIKYTRSVVNLPCVDDVLCRLRSVL